MEFDSGSISWMLKNVTSKMLQSLLQKIDGQKDIVLCDQLISVIDLICSYKVLKENGVDKIFKIDSAPTANSKRLCFIVKPTISDVKKVCNWLNVFQSKDIHDVQFWIIFVPQKSYDCEKYLEQEGLYGYFTIWDFPLGFIPLDNDLFSLELDDLYQDYLLFGDYRFLNDVVFGVHQFQKLIGPTDIMLMKGRASEFICDNLQKLNVISGMVEEKKQSNDCVFDLLVIDREEDYVSLFLSQLNYSGILDETFSIKCGKIEMAPDLESNATTAPAAKHNLFGSDAIFSEVQDMSFSSVCVSLKEKGQKLRQKCSERESMSLTEIKNFIQSNELRTIQSEHKALFLHINICETIMKRKKIQNFSEHLRVERNLIEGIESRGSLNFIEDGIIKQWPKSCMLRLICLYSICHSGISHKELHSLIRYYTQSYGYQHIITFNNLKKLGIIFESTNQFNFVTPSTQKLMPYQTSIQSAATTTTSESIKKFRHVIKKFNLIPLLENECYNIRTPSDCGYVFAGAYFPFVCKLVQNFFELKSHSQMEDYCKHSQCKQQPSIIPNQFTGRDLQTKTKRIQIVLFVGGVTYAEVSALRFLSKQKSIPILILTTSIINGNTFLQTLFTKSF